MYVDSSRTILLIGLSKMTINIYCGALYCLIWVTMLMFIIVIIIMKCLFCNLQFEFNNNNNNSGFTIIISFRHIYLANLRR
jgi:hypothetical protein